MNRPLVTLRGALAQRRQRAPGATRWALHSDLRSISTATSQVFNPKRFSLSETSVDG